MHKALYNHNNLLCLSFSLDNGGHWSINQAQLHVIEKSLYKHVLEYKKERKQL